MLIKFAHSAQTSGVDSPSPTLPEGGMAHIRVPHATGKEFLYFFFF